MNPADLNAAQLFEDAKRCSYTQDDIDAAAKRLSDRAEREWKNYAQESVTCEVIGGVLYAFGSELACLRLEHRMRVGRARYSENLKSWYYTTEKTAFLVGSTTRWEHERKIP